MYCFNLSWEKRNKCKEGEKRERAKEGRKVGRRMCIWMDVAYSNKEKEEGNIERRKKCKIKHGGRVVNIPASY
jgi:hypothetical protein